jgi:nitrogen regulatory protein P-II 1
MKMVIAYVQSFMAPAVIDAMRAHPELTGATMSKAQGFGRGRTRGTSTQPEGEFVGTRQQVRIETLVPDRLAPEIVELIIAAARTGNPGDGKVCVTPLDHVVRIRTGEADDLAI